MGPVSGAYLYLTALVMMIYLVLLARFLPYTSWEANAFQMVLSCSFLSLVLFELVAMSTATTAWDPSRYSRDFEATVLEVAFVLLIVVTIVLLAVLMLVSLRCYHD